MAGAKCVKQLTLDVSYEYSEQQVAQSLKNNEIVHVSPTSPCRIKIINENTILEHFWSFKINPALLKASCIK